MEWEKNKLQAELGVSKLQAEDLFKTYHNKVPFVKQLMDATMKRAQDSGKIRTLMGRLCRFPLWEPNQFGIHKALPHEASAQGTRTRNQTSVYLQSIE